jgi:hypothetical protein
MIHSPFQIRGVIEGFYGVYYTPPERNDLIQLLRNKDITSTFTAQKMTASIEPAGGSLIQRL